MFNIIIDTIVTAALAVSGAACDAGTFVADTATETAAVVCDFTVDTYSEAAAWVDDVIGCIFENQETTNTLEETDVENIQAETILYEDVTTTWPD